MAQNRPAPAAPVRVIQAYFSGGRPPARLVTRVYPSPYRAGPPHPATVAPAAAPHAARLQKKDAPGAPPPHAAKARSDAAAQRKQAGARPPHAASPQAQGAPDRPRHAATAQRSPLGDDVHAFQTPPDLLDAARGRTPAELPPVVRRKMETFFEADLSDVRVHVGHEAPAIGAIAFTLGSDIYFAPGQYDPHSPRGQELLGHELTHVLQQRDGRVQNPFGAGTAVVQDAALEEEADRMGQLIASAPRPRTSYRVELQRDAAQRAQASPREGSRSAQQRRGGYQLVVGAYLHEDKDLPEPLAGHAFVALEGPSGEREAYGFSPAGYGDYDPRRDLGKLAAGVEGVVHDDAAAFEKRGVKTRAYVITPEQAEAARAKIEEYRAGKHPFRARDQQCTAFAADVAGAADVDEVGALRGRPPREVYRKL